MQCPSQIQPRLEAGLLDLDYSTLTIRSLQKVKCKC